MGCASISTHNRKAETSLGEGQVKYANLFLHRYVSERWKTATIIQRVYLVIFSVWYKGIIIGFETRKVINRYRSLEMVGLTVTASFLAYSLRDHIDQWESLLPIFISLTVLVLTAFSVVWILLLAFTTMANLLLNRYSKHSYPTGEKDVFATLLMLEEQDTLRTAQAYVMAFSHRGVTHVTAALAIIFASTVDNDGQ